MEMTAKVKLLGSSLTVLRVTLINEKMICSVSTWARVSMVVLVKSAIRTINRDREKLIMLLKPILWSEKEVGVLKSLVDKASQLQVPSLNHRAEGLPQLEFHQRALIMEFSWADRTSMKRKMHPAILSKGKALSFLREHLAVVHKPLARTPA
jgi:hypothetical protein